MKKLYYVAQNSDMTEGKGVPVVVAIFDNEKEAEKATEGRAPMGVGRGSIYVQRPLDSDVYGKRLELGVLGSSLRFSELFEEVYGYRKSWNGKWDYGWHDQRDAPMNDPEYAKFQALLKKFGGA